MEEDDDKFWRMVHKSVDDLIGTINIIRVASNVSKFRDWLKVYHNIQNDSDLFIGYKFFLTTSINKLISSIQLNSSLELYSDLVLYRADFNEIPIKDIPHSCEKTIVIKNIWNSTIDIRKSKNWQQIQLGIINLNELFLESDKILKSSRLTKKGLEKKQALKYVTEDLLFTYYNDTCRGRPHCTITASITKPQINRNEFYRSFDGYTYTLQYIWFELLGKETFEKTCLKDLHRALEIYEKIADETIENKVGVTVTDEELRTDYIKNTNFQVNKNIDRPPILNLKSDDIFRNDTKIVVFPYIIGTSASLSENDIRRMEDDRKELIKLKGWFALDNFVGIIEKEIMSPIQKKLHKNLGLSPLLYINSGKKDFLSVYKSKNGLMEPDYLTKKDPKSLNKLLAYRLLWYQACVLDTQQLLNFNGAPAFLRILAGSIELNKIDNRLKTIIRIFKHPEPFEEGYEYSFGILIESSGLISDGSGWLIFYQCADDYSHQGLYNLTNIKSYIEENKSKLDKKTVIINKQIFKNYLMTIGASSAFDKIVQQTPYGPVDSFSISEIQQKTNDTLDNIKGKFFEYMFNKWISDSGKYDKTICDFYINNEQIDCIGINDGSVDVFECKLNVHSKSNSDTSMKTIINQINNKVQAIKNSKQYKDKIVKPFIVTFYDISSDHRKLLLVKNGINIDYCNMESKFINLKNFDNSTIDILKFKWEHILY